MTQEVINVGTVAGDNTGDPGRTAFQKINNNFSELYAASGGGVYLTGVAGTNTITGSLTGYSAYFAGSTVAFVASGANTGAATLNINGLGAKSITKQGSTALSQGDIKAGQIVMATYDGTRFQLIPSKINQIVSVTDFGAVGDGTTDDSAAINAAIASNRNIYFPAGTYLIASSVRVVSKSNVVLQGAGVDVAIIKCSPSATFTLPALDIRTSTNVYVNGLTLDSNSNASLGSVTNNLSIVFFLACTDTAFSDSKILHSYVGVAINSCTRFRIERNYLRKDAIATTRNYNINCSSNVSVSSQGEINDNFCLNSGSGFIGAEINISRNQFIYNSYGAAIATFGNGASGTTPGLFYGKYFISDNLCRSGTQRDADGFMVAGMEIAGGYSRIQNNTIHDNAGEGIRLFAYQSICTGNIVFGNGTGLDGTFRQSGITAWDATTIPGYNASYSLISGNRCFDNASGTQLYGYYEQQSTLVGMTVQDNNLDNNVTGPYVLASSKALNTYDFNTVVNYTPTMISTAGTITTVGAIQGQYFLKGRIVYFQAQGTITTNGTGAGSIQISLPIQASSTATSRWVVLGRGDAISGNSLIGVIAAGGLQVVLTNYDATYPGANGERIAVTGWYQI